jgi:hypothetical protein
MIAASLPSEELIKNSDEVCQIFLEILREGLLRIRTAGWSGRSEVCALEADHLHNIPTILSKCTLASISYYYDIERPAFLRMTATDSKPELFEPYWERLRAALIQIHAAKSD